MNSDKKFDIKHTRKLFKEYDEVRSRLFSRAEEIWLALKGQLPYFNFEDVEFLNPDRICFHYQSVNLMGEDVWRSFGFPVHWLNIDSDDIKKEYEKSDNKMLVYF